MRARRLTTRPLALGLLLLAVVGSTAGWKASEKTVSVSVDGSVRHLATHAGSVRGLLQQAHLTVGSHDLLAPGPGAHLADGATVVLRRGRQMTLVVDGLSRDVWVTATSVDEALGQIGLRTDGALLSADRSRAIPLKGFSLDVRTPRAVTVLDAGRTLHLTSTGLHLSDALAALHVALRPADLIDQALTTDLRDGLTVRITRHDASQVASDVPVAFAKRRIGDPAHFHGIDTLEQSGRVGRLHRVYALTYVDHRLTGRRIVSETVTLQPVTQIVGYGVKNRPRPQPAPRPAARRSTSTSSGSVSSSGGLNWASLANCESGGNPRAVSSNGQYRGLYQFSLGTWRGVGGSGDPIDASGSEQTHRAQVLYGRSGRSAWPVCGRYL